MLLRLADEVNAYNKRNKSQKNFRYKTNMREKWVLNKFHFQYLWDINKVMILRKD